MCCLILSRSFGLVVLTEPPDLDTRDHINNLLMIHALSGSKNDLPESDALSLVDLKQYLNIVMSIEAELLEEASDLLKAYYMASRRARSSSFCGPDVPIRTLKSL